ncbi:MAG: DnaD domain protein [Eubacteriales bacterium]|nr:DnaD domain protein [Eubacteriales bacterium]
MTLHKYTAGDFTLVQNRFLDEYMISANGEFVKIYLYLLRCSSAEREISIASIADALNHTEGDVKRALSYWNRKKLLQLSFNDDGILTDIVLTSDIDPAKEQTERVKSYASLLNERENTGKTVQMPERISVSAARKKELSEQEDIQQLIYIAQQYLGKILSSTEVTHILYFYDELHFSPDLIEYLVEYCVSKGKKSIHYISTVAMEWSKRGISTVEEAKKDSNLFQKDYYAIMNALGIKDHAPTPIECKWMSKWLDQMAFSLEIVLEACQRTIMRTHKPSFEYADSILKSWKKKNVKTLSDIEKLDKEASSRQAENTASKTGAQNRFNNFPQRKYDFNQLEKKLLDY